MSVSPGLVAYKLGFQISPIILSGGIAQNMPFQVLPIIAITEAANFVSGLLSGNENIELDDFFAYYDPLPGASLVNNEVGTYPFANQTIAANAIIAEPLTISMRMITPVRNPLGYAIKLATMTALQAVLASHNGQGGTYIVVTPSYIYSNCLMTGMRDISGGQSKQAQYEWQIDFVQPLLTLAAAQSAYSSLMSKMSNFLPVNGSPTSLLSGLGPAVGSSVVPDSPSLIPTSGAFTGASVTSTPLPPP